MVRRPKQPPLWMASSLSLRDVVLAGVSCPSAHFGTQLNCSQEHHTLRQLSRNWILCLALPYRINRVERPRR